MPPLNIRTKSSGPIWRRIQRQTAASTLERIWNLFRVNYHHLAGMPEKILAFFRFIGPAGNELERSQRYRPINTGLRDY